MAREIPKSLRLSELRFALVLPKSKIAFEKGWRTTKNYAYDHPKIKAHLATGGNLSLLCGSAYGVVVVDWDGVEDTETIMNILPPTLTQRTGGGGLHFIFLSDTFDKQLILKKDGVHYGEVQADGQLIIVEPSIHENGKPYKIERDLPLTRISKNKLMRLLNPFYSKVTSKTLPQLASEPKIDLESSKLKDSQLLVETITPHWCDGTRNHLAIPLIAYLLKSGIPEKETKAVMRAIAKEADSLPNDLDKWTTYQYKRVRAGDIKIHGKGGLSGISGLQTFFESVFAEDKNKLRDTLSSIRLAVEGKPVVYEITETGKVKFIPKLVADHLVSNFEFVSHFGSSKIWWFNQALGFNDVGGDSFIRRQIESMAPNAGINDKREVIQHIQDRVSLTNSEFQELEMPLNILSLKNGHLDINTLKLTEPNSKLFIVNHHPVNYDPKAKCPTIWAFLNKLCDGDQVKVRWLIDIAGLCLYRSNKLDPLIIFLYGEGENGKSKYIELLEALLGVNNTIETDIQTLEFNPFKASRVEFKNAVFGPDITDQPLKRAGKVKAISSGDRITVEKKGQDSREITPYAKQLYSCNGLPQIEDTTHASLRRLFVIHFTHNFKDDPDKDHEIVDKITTEAELSGFLNIALKALKRLIKTGGIKDRPPVEEMSAFYTLHSDPVASYWNIYLEDGVPEDYIPKHSLFKEIKVFCVKHGVKTPSRAKVGERLQELGGAYSSKARGLSEGQVTVWRGLTWKQQERVESEPTPTLMKSKEDLPKMILDYMRSLNEVEIIESKVEAYGLSVGGSEKEVFSAIDSLKFKGLIKSPSNNVIELVKQEAKT